MTIHSFKDYSVEQLIEEDLFTRWVIEKDNSLDFFWKRYKNSYPDQVETLEEARRLLELSHNYFEAKELSLHGPPNNFDTILTEKFRDEVSRITKSQSLFKGQFYRLSIAASILLIVGISAFFFLRYDLNSHASTNNIEYVTGKAEWKKILLPDGSSVELNANSQLSLTEEWNDGGTRKVWLKGEAFFTVKKIPSTNAKFTVVTKDLEVDVLGTAFSVNTRNKHTEVFLEEGNITLDMQGRIEQIEPGEFISYSQATKKIIDRYKESEEIHSKWKDGVLKITDSSMKEILAEVEAIYGIDIIVKDPALLDKVGSVAIPVDNLDMATTILERVLNVKMDRKEKQVFIN